MKKKNVGAWAFIAVFVLLSVGCFVYGFRNPTMIVYSICSALLAVMLYKSKSKKEEENERNGE